MRPIITCSALLACLTLDACVAEGPQSAELTRARTLVEQADKAHAQRYAPEDLQRARDELGAAETANNQGHYDLARSDAESAAVDADVATARASAGEAQRAAAEVKRSNAATIAPDAAAPARPLESEPPQ